MKVTTNNTKEATMSEDEKIEKLTEYGKKINRRKTSKNLDFLSTHKKLMGRWVDEKFTYPTMGKLILKGYGIKISNPTIRKFCLENFKIEKWKNAKPNKITIIEKIIENKILDPYTFNVDKILNDKEKTYLENEGEYALKKIIEWAEKNINDEDLERVKIVIGKISRKREDEKKIADEKINRIIQKLYESVKFEKVYNIEIEEREIFIKNYDALLEKIDMAETTIEIKNKSEDVAKTVQEHFEGKDIL